MKISAFLHSPVFRLTVFAVVVLLVSALLNRAPGPAARALRLDPESALAARQQVFGAVRGSATLLIYPVLIDGRLDSESACLLAEKLAAARVAALCVVGGPLPLPAAPEHPAAEGSVLARALSAHLAAHPSDADYVLYVRYALRAAGWEHGSAELVLCDARGGLVFHELGDARRAEFRALRPVTKEDCTELVVRRLRERFVPASTPLPTAAQPAAPAPVALRVSLP
jgi:hypothetical protein